MADTCVTVSGGYAVLFSAVSHPALSLSGLHNMCVVKAEPPEDRDHVRDVRSYSWVSRHLSTENMWLKNRFK